MAGDSGLTVSPEHWLWLLGRQGLDGEAGAEVPGHWQKGLWRPLLRTALPWQLTPCLEMALKPGLRCTGPQAPEEPHPRLRLRFWPEGQVVDSRRTSHTKPSKTPQKEPELSTSPGATASRYLQAGASPTFLPRSNLCEPQLSLPITGLLWSVAAAVVKCPLRVP